jgi:hypothetical protein
VRDDKRKINGFVDFSQKVILQNKVLYVDRLWLKIL